MRQKARRGRTLSDRGRRLREGGARSDRKGSRSARPGSHRPGVPQVRRNSSRSSKCSSGSGKRRFRIEAAERERAGCCRDQAEHPVVFVPMEGGWRLGVQTDGLTNGLISVFVPGSPVRIQGRSFPFRRPTFDLPASKLVAALNCVRRRARGASALGAQWPAKAQRRFVFRVALRTAT